MLTEGLRRAARGADVAIAHLEARARPATLSLLEQLDPDGQKRSTEVAAIVEQRPDIVLLDDLAGSSPSGRPHWQLAEQFLRHGLDVISTVTIGQLESLRDEVAGILGEAPVRTVPDRIVQGADQVELVDVTPEAMRRRIAHGNVFTPESLRPEDADLFHGDAYAQLRALLMRWMSDRLSVRHHETVVVAVPDATSSHTVLRRAARIAQRTGARLVGVHVGHDGTGDTGSDERRSAVEALGGEYHEVHGNDVAASLLAFAESMGAAQLVMGASSTRRFGRALAASVVDDVTRRSPDIDIHVVPIGAPPVSPLWQFPADPVARGRRWWAAAGGAVLLAVLTAALVSLRSDLSVATSLALYLLAVVGITAAGGRWPGLASALAAPLLANWFLIPPYGTLRIASRDNVLELVVFVSVSAIVAWFVGTTARRGDEAHRAWRDAQALAALSSASALESLDAIVDLLVETFGFDSVSVVRSTIDEGPFGDVEILAASGGPAPSSPADAVVQSINGSTWLIASGARLTADDHRLLNSFVRQLSTSLEQHRLRQVALDASALERADELRTAMLRAVSHDLRSPLAGIKATVSTLRQADVEWPPEQEAEFLASIEDETDRLTAIVTNLLDLGRLESGMLRPSLGAHSVEEVVPTALRGVGVDVKRCAVEIDPGLPEVEADAALLDRVIANLVHNALHWSPADATVTVRAHRRRDLVQIHVIDHGPGIPAEQRSVVVQPFHRLADTSAGGGLGLGLAIADRLTAAMNGGLELRDTPGGGLTAVVSLRVAVPE